MDYTENDDVYFHSQPSTHLYLTDIRVCTLTACYSAQHTTESGDDCLHPALDLSLVQPPLRLN